MLFADYDPCWILHRGMVDFKQVKLQPDKLKWLIELYIMISGFKERDILVYVVQSFWNSINVYFALDAVEFPKAGVMVVMPMSPDHFRLCVKDFA